MADPSLGRRFWLYSLPLIALATIGCSNADGVREDRTIEFSADDASTSFKHGNEGVFLANRKQGELTKVFEPDKDVIATSTPLWDPAGERMLFTTAKALAADDEPPPANSAPWGDQPEGLRFHPHTVVYTCWLHEKPDERKKDNTSKPVKLFEAQCAHPGYVAANLAVRWHPTTDHLVYIDQTDSGKLGVFEFDLTTEKTRRVFPKVADAVVFDFSPSSENLVCVVGNVEAARDDGIWIGRPGDSNWWHVPESGYLATAEPLDLVERLRRTRPSWRPDGKEFVFASYRRGTDATTDATPDGIYRLLRVDLAEHRVDCWQRAPGAFRDVRYAPDGKRAGYVVDADQPELHLQELSEPTSKRIGKLPIRKFVGWNASGENLAYVVPQQAALPGKNEWAFLFSAAETPRDAVHLTDGRGERRGRVVFSEMRVTFPHWSRTGQKLSLWATFAPSIRSRLSQILGLGLRLGDPAVILDAQTGKLTWMPVNGTEKAQVGHYYLLKRDYAEARRWYEQAENETPHASGRSETVRDLFEPPRGLRRFLFFSYYCLQKLGQEDAARQRLDEFNRLCVPNIGEHIDEPLTESAERERSWLRLDDGDQVKCLLRLLRDLYIGEVFLSLDARDDGQEFLQNAMNSAENDADKLTKAIVLAQFLLLAGEEKTYVDLATDTIAPLMIERLKNWTPDWQQEEAANGLSPNTLLAATAGCSLLPMYSREFWHNCHQTSWTSCFRRGKQ